MSRRILSSLLAVVFLAGLIPIVPTDAAAPITPVQTPPNILSALVPSVATGSNAKITSRYSRVPDEILVRYRQPSIDISTVGGAARARTMELSYGLSARSVLRHDNISVLTVGTGQTVDSAIATLQTDPSVDIVQPNYHYVPFMADPNDPYFNTLYALKNTGQSVNGWVGSSGSDMRWSQAMDVFSGAVSTTGTTVAVLDTGVAYEHPDLAGRMWSSTQCKSDTNANIGTCNNGYNYDNNTANPMPKDMDHGTHIAGTIAATMNNSTGVVGVNPNARIMGIEVENFTTAEIIQGIHFAANNGARIINASWGMYDAGSLYHDQLLYNAVRDFPGLFVNAAGNCWFNHEDGGQDNGSNPNPQCAGKTHINYPQYFAHASDLGPALPNILVVAATDNTDALASFSDYGPTSVHVGAPGVEIYSSVLSPIGLYNESFTSATVGSNGPFTIGGTTSSRWAVGNLLTHTGMYTDSVRPFPSNENVYAQSPVIDLSGVPSATMSFFIWCDTPITGYYDNYLSLDFGSSGIFPPWSGYSYNEEALRLNYSPTDYTLGGYAGAYAVVSDATIPSAYLTSTFQYRLSWHTRNAVDNNGGCFVSNIGITGYDNGRLNGYGFKDGTSMATPQVAGLASLVWSYRPDLTAVDIKNAIMANGDSIASLSGKTVSGKRINAYKTLLALTPSPDVAAIHAYAGTGRVTELSDGWAVGSGAYVEWSTAAVVPSMMSGYTVQVLSGATIISSTGTTSTGLTLSFTGNALYTVSVMGQRIDGATGSVATRILRAYATPPSAPTSITLNNNQIITASTSQTGIVLAGSGVLADSGATVIYRITSGGSVVSGTGAFVGTTFSIGGIDTTPLPDGTITASVALRDPVGGLSSSGSTSIVKSTSTGSAPVGSLTFLSGAYTSTGTTTVRLGTTRSGTYALSGTTLAVHTGSISTGTIDLPITFSGADGVQSVSAIFYDTFSTPSATVTGSIVLDTAPPVVSISFVGTTLTGAMSSYTFTGNISDLTLSGVTVSGALATVSGSVWQSTLPIAPGANTLAIVATDLVGHSTSTGLTVWDVPSTPSGITVSPIGSGSVRIRYATDMTATGSLAYGTGSMSTLLDGASSTGHIFTLTGLAVDTTYQYQVAGAVSGHTGAVSSVMTFHTPQPLDVSGSTGTVSVTGAVQLAGATATGTVWHESSGSSLQLQSLTGASTVSIPTDRTTVIAGSGTWDGIIQPPTPTVASGSFTLTGYSRIPELTFKIGSDSDTLIFSGAAASVSLDVGASYDGQTLSVYRSDDGQSTFTLVGTCTVALGACMFSTSQFSDFAILTPLDDVPDAFSFTPTTGVYTGTPTTSDTITITGMSSSTGASTTLGSLIIDSVNVGSTGTVSSGSTVAVQITSSASYSTSVSATVTIGGVSALYTVTTRANPGGSSGGWGWGGWGGGWSSSVSPPPGTSYLVSAPSASGTISPTGTYTPPIVAPPAPVVRTPPSVLYQTGILSRKKKTPVKHILKTSFSDTRASFAHDAIETLMAKGIVHGYADGTYRPDRPISRAEYLAVILRAFPRTATGVNVSISSFTDIRVDWQVPIIETAYRLGIISGQQASDGRRYYRPDDTITRAEALKILLLATGIRPTTAPTDIRLVDVATHWQIPVFETAYRIGIVAGQKRSDGKRYFRPDDPITRAETAKVVVWMADALQTQ